MVARQFRVLEAASSSPATSTMKKDRVYPCPFSWTKWLGVRNRFKPQVEHRFSTLFVRLVAELARRSSESRHFDQKSFESDLKALFL